MKHIELQRVAPADIEARSMELIGRELGCSRRSSCPWSSG